MRFNTGFLIFCPVFNSSFFQKDHFNTDPLDTRYYLAYFHQLLQ
jgi:hypothetical protein